MTRRFFLLLPASGCLAHAWSKEFDLPAPGPVKQNAFISCPVDFFPGKNI